MSVTKIPLRISYRLLVANFKIIFKFENNEKSDWYFLTHGPLRAYYLRRNELNFLELVLDSRAFFIPFQSVN